MLVEYLIETGVVVNKQRKERKKHSIDQRQHSNCGAWSVGHLWLLSSIWVTLVFSRYHYNSRFSFWRVSTRVVWERFALVAQSAYFRTLVSSDSEHVGAPSGTGCSRIFSMSSDVFSPRTGTPFPYRKFWRKGTVSPWWQMPLRGYLNLLATWSPKPGVTSSIKAIV